MYPFDLPNACTVSDGVISAGQPSAEQLKSVAAAGVRTIVNLCAPRECGWDEAAVVTSLGMRYVEIPVPDAAAVTAANARTLHALLEDSASHPAIVHCGSGNRVGALFALRAFHEQACDVETALERGRRAGLTRLEPHVRDCLVKGR